MPNYATAALLLLAVAPAAAQESAVPVPASVRLEGVPPISSAIPEALAPYASAKRTIALAWHPAKRQLVVANDSGQFVQAYAIDGPGAPRHQLTSFSEGGLASAVFEPTQGSYLILRKDSGSSVSHLYRHDIGTGTTTPLTEGKSRNFGPAFANRSRLIAFTSTRRNDTDRDIYVMDPNDPSSARLACETKGTWYVAGWSPDDRELLVWESVSNLESYLWRVDVKTCEKTQVTARVTAPEVWTPSGNVPQFSPDGAAIYAASNRQSEFYRMWRQDVVSGAWKPLTSGRDSVETFALSPDGRTLAVVFARHGASELELLDAASGDVKKRPRLPAGQTVGFVQWRPDGTELAITMWTKRSFGDVYTVNARTGATSRWTASESAGFDFDSLPDPQIIRWQSFDGRTISGVLNRPAVRFKGRRPVIINIHGGPNQQERPRFQGRSAYFLNELGIAIIYPNVRGSLGFGRAFSSMDDGERREDAVKDIGALLDWIARQPFLDKDRVMVTGPSYGGYMTYAVAAAYPNRIRCAYAALAISNFVSYLETTEPSRIADRRVEYGDERDPKMREFLLRISPVTNAAKIRVPLLIAHGRKDAFVPIAQAEEMYRLVKANGVPVWMVVYEDEAHGFAGRVANDFHFYTWVAFVQQYLLRDVTTRPVTAASPRSSPGLPSAR